jgi:Luciferase-like monooxygenase
VTADARHGGQCRLAPVRTDVFLLAGQFPGSTQGQALANTLTYALAAERAGFTGAWIAEHHFGSYGTCPSSLTLAGYLLGATTTLRGDPGLCAEQLADAITQTGVRHVLLMVEGAGDPAATVENITRFGAEILPRLRC